MEYGERKDRPWLSLEEKIEAGGYYTITLYDPSTIGAVKAGQWNYETEATGLKDAVRKVIKHHIECLTPIYTEYEDIGIEPVYATKVKVERRSDEAFLDTVWDNPVFRETYMRNWEPDMKTRTLAAILRKDPHLSQHYGFRYTEVWSESLNK